MKPDATPLAPDEALQMIAGAFNEEVANLSPDSARDALAGWDSMGVLMLTAELDERFDIELSSEDSSKMRSVGDILQFLRARQLLRE